MKKFPHLVQMHNTFAKDGLVCVSLDVNTDELESMDRVLAFLKRQGATFPNFILRDTEANLESFTTKYALEFTPAVLLFDRDGKRVRVPEDANNEELERIVKETLGVK